MWVLIVVLDQNIMTPRKNHQSKSGMVSLISK